MSQLKLFLGTGFGVGYAPIAPGTFGSLSALLPLYAALYYNWIFIIPVGVILFSALSLWVSPLFEERFGKDPANLVMDEWAGQFLCFLGIAFTGTFITDITIIITGFILFRLFDIWKPLGISKLQKLRGGWGVLADDLLAGLYALICLKTLIFIRMNYIDLV